MNDHAQPQHSHTDPEIAALVERVSHCLSELAQRQDELLPALQGDAPLAKPHGHPPEDRNTLFKVARKLCDAEKFHQALPIALYLASHHGEDHRYTFLAGACLQRLHLAPEALQMYLLCMKAAGPQIAPMYRAGECLLSIGENEKALQAFEEAFDLGRASSDYREMQGMASKRIEQCRASA